MTKPASPLQDSLFDLHRERLDNGLRVWVKPRPGTATVILLLQISVGSRHETQANNGLSHFLEHMLFTGTARWSEQEVVDLIRRRGGEANARTAHEDTVLWLHLKAEDLDLGLEWLGEVVFRPRLSEDKFHKERQVIIEEKGGEIGAFESVGDLIEDLGLGWNVFRAVKHRLYPHSSLLLPVIGKDRSLRRIRYPDLLAFYRRHYLPNNMALIVVGDVDAGLVSERAAHHLGGFAPGPLPPRPASPAPPAEGFSLKLKGPNLNDQGQLLLGAPLPGLNHPDRYALGVLAELLDTVLTQSLRYERGLVYGIDVYPSLYTDAGYFAIYTTADTAKFPDILADVEARLDQALAGGFDAAAVAEARDAIGGRLLLGMESNADVGWWLAEMALFTPEGQPVPNLFAEVDRVSPADITRVAQAYLRPEQRFRSIHRPGLTPAALAKPALLGAGLGAAALGAWLLNRRRKRPRKAA